MKLEDILNSEEMSTGLKAREAFHIVEKAEERAGTKCDTNAMLYAIDYAYRLGEARGRSEGTRKEKQRNAYIYSANFYTLDRISEEVGLNIQTLRKMVKDGTLKAKKVGTKYVATKEAVAELLEKESGSDED